MDWHEPPEMPNSPATFSFTRRFNVEYGTSAACRSCTRLLGGLRVALHSAMFPVRWGEASIHGEITVGSQAVSFKCTPCHTTCSRCVSVCMKYGRERAKIGPPLGNVCTNYASRSWLKMKSTKGHQYCACQLASPNPYRANMHVSVFGWCAGELYSFPIHALNTPASADRGLGKEVSSRIFRFATPLQPFSFHRAAWVN